MCMAATKQNDAGGKKNTAQISETWAKRGFSCDMWIDPPGQCWEDFVHAVDELLCVVDGQLEFEMDGIVMRFSPWEEVFIPAHVKHSVRNRGSSVARWLYGYKR